jgi:hypothetical protein
MGVAGRKAISLRLDQVAQALVLAQERLRTVEERLEQMGKVRAEAAWTAEALAGFDRLWDKLNEDNRARLVGCLVQRVVVNEGANTLRIELVDHSVEIEDAA